jgi:hypothetical protein
MSSLLEALLQNPRVAVFAPVDDHALSPGSERWERFFGGVRADNVDVMAILPIVGVMHERDLRKNPSYMTYHGTMRDRAAIEEGALRLRAWLHADGPNYGRFVVLSGGPLMPIWSRAIAKTPAALRTTLIPVRPKTVRNANSVSGLPGLESDTVRVRLVNAIGKGA